MNDDCEIQDLVIYRMAIVGRLTSPVVHDLNNAMSPLVGNLQILQFKASSGIHATAEDLEQLEQDAVSVSQRAQTLASMAREAMRDDPPVPSVVGDCLREMDFLIGHHLKRRGVTVMLYLPPSLPAMCTSSIDIRLVAADLMLLYQNALPEGGDLNITCSHVESEQITIQFTTSPGTGLPTPFPELLGLASCLTSRGMSLKFPTRDDNETRMILTPAQA